MKRVFTAVLLFFCLAGCGEQGMGLTGHSAVDTFSADFFAMDTFMSISAYHDGKGNVDITSGMQQRIAELDATLSRTQTRGEIYRLNHAGGAVTEVGQDTYHAIEQAVQFAAFTNGAFDPTLAPVTDLWGINTDNARVPEQAELDAALAQTGYEKICLLGNNQVQLLDGAQIDLGGIGKGIAADEVHSMGQEDSWSILAKLGGNIGAYGKNLNRRDGNWVVGIADPDGSPEPIATISGQDISVVTSGDYERFFEQDGKRYHHIFDPSTGCPAESGLRSVTVVDENSTRADALTTALFVMGLDDGMEFCKQNNIAAVFVTAAQQIYTSPAISTVCEFSFQGGTMGYAYEG